MRRIGMLVLMGFCFFGSRASAQVEVKSGFTDESVELRDDTAYYVIIGGDVGECKLEPLPKIDGMHIGQWEGPQRRSEFSIVNGRRRQNVTLTYVAPVVPSRVGRFTIPSITVLVDGKEYKTEPATILVTKPATDEQLALLRVFPDKTTVYVNEPLMVTVEALIYDPLRRRLPRDGLSMELPWFYGPSGSTVMEGAEFTGSPQWVCRVNRQDPWPMESERREIDGRPYLVLRNRRQYLPTEAGSLVFDSSFFRVVYLEDTGRVTIFGEPQWQQKRTSSIADGFTVTVKALPETGKPSDFFGAVGSYTFKVDVSARQVRVGDSVKVTAKILGEGNIRFLASIPPLGDFSKFRLFGTLENKTLEGRQVDYDLSPLDMAATEIPPLRFSYFDTKDGKYRTVEQGPFPLKVEPAPERTGLKELPGESSKQKIEIREEDIAYIKTDLKSIEETISMFPSPAMLLSAFTTPLILAGAAFVWRRRRDSLLANPRRVRRLSAFGQATRAANELEPSLAQLPPGEAGSRVAKVLAAYLGDVFGLPANRFLEERLAAIPEVHQLSEPLRLKLASLFERCHFLTYAGATSSALRPMELLKEVRAVLAEIEKELP